MNRVQKIAWSFVVMISVAFLLSCIAIAILYFKVGMPKALAGLGFMGIAGLGGFSPLIFQTEKGKVTLDERYRLINRRAALAGFGTSYLLVGLGVHDSIFYSWAESLNIGYLAALHIWGNWPQYVLCPFRGDFGSVRLE